MNLITDRDYINIMNLLGDVLKKYGLNTNETQELKNKIHRLILDKVR